MSSATPARRRPARRRFAARVVRAIAASKILGIRAGHSDHRIIGVWVVVLEGRVFVRSWDGKAGGWYRTFLEEPRGVMAIGGRELAVRAVAVRSERMRAAVSRAYAEKYTTPGARQYVRGFALARRAERTIELQPL
jgi:hypothetical protein